MLHVWTLRWIGGNILCFLSKVDVFGSHPVKRHDLDAWRFCLSGEGEGFGGRGFALEEHVACTDHCEDRRAHGHVGEMLAPSKEAAE